MKLYEALIVLGRIAAELCAYYNAKYMYSLGGTSLSPALTTYVGHSILVITIIKDLKNYRKILKRETEYTFGKFFIITFLLTIIFNTSHLPKYYALNNISDVALVAISGLSVVFTDIISCVNSKYTNKSIFCFISSMLGVFLIFLNYYNDFKKSILIIGCILGSFSIGIYNVVIKKCTEYRKPKPILQRKPFKEKRKIHNTKRKRMKPTSLQINFIEKQKSQKTSIFKNFFKKRINAKLYKNLKFIKHYIGLTGLITLLFYWPFIFISDPHPTFNPKLIIHIILATILSFTQNILYYILITSQTPQFVQITGILLQPTITLIEIVTHGFKGYFNIIGFILIFISFIVIN